METELENPEYANLELVTTVYGDDDDQKSFQEAQGLLATYPDLAGIIAPPRSGSPRPRAGSDPGRSGVL